MSRDIGVNFALGASLNSGFKGSMSAARSEIAGLAQGIRRLESSNVGKLGADFVAQKSKIKGLGTELKDAKAQLAALKARADASGGATGTLARQIAQAERRVSGLSGNLRTANERYREHIARVRTAEGSVRNLGRNYQGLAADIQRAQRRQQSLSASLARRDGLRDQRSDLQGRIMGTVGMGMAAAAPAGLAIGFEDSMARVGALARADSKELAQLTAQARQLGRDTTFTASQAAEGMGYLAMAGFSVNQTMEAMPGMLNLAAAGNTDLGRTADIASNILSGFKMKAAQMGRVSDVLAKTFTTSNTTLETLGETMKYVGPVAASVGLEVEDMAAATGLLGSVGIQGSQAGTALRAALLRLAAPPKMAKDALADLTGAAGPELDELYEQIEDVAGASQTLSDLGMNTKDARGNLRPLVDILEELNAKTKDMGTGERAEVFKKVFGTEASAAMIALADKAGQTVDDDGSKITFIDEDGVKKETTALRKYVWDLKHAGGTCDRIAQMMNATTGGSLRRMGSAFEDLGIAVGNIFLPTIAKGADFLGRMAVKASELVQRFPILSSAVIHVGGGIAGLAVGSLVLGYAFNTLRTGLNMARGAMLLFSGVQTATAGTTRTLTIWQQLSRLATLSWRDALTGGGTAVVGLAGRVAAFAGIQRGATIGTVAFTLAQKIMAAGSAIAGGALRVLGTAMKFALGPVGLLIGALTIGVGLIIDNWDTVGPYFTALWDGIVGTFKNAWEFIQGILDKVAGAASWVGDTIESIPVLGGAKRGIGKAWDWAFGNEDEKAKEFTGLSQTVQAAVPMAAAPALKKPTAKGADTPALTAEESVAPATMGANALVPQRADSEGNVSRARKAAPEFLSPGSGDLSAMGGGTSVTVPMTFTVQGLDAATFKQKMKECKSDIEAIIKRVVADCQHQQTRTAYAPQ